MIYLDSHDEFRLHPCALGNSEERLDGEVLKEAQRRTGRKTGGLGDLALSYRIFEASGVS